jgi:hypothetical protein
MPRSEQISRPIQQLRLPMHDLVGVHSVALRQLGERVPTLERLARHFRFEDGERFPRRLLLISRSCSAGSMPPLGRDSTYPAVRVS